MDELTTKPELRRRIREHLRAASDEQLKEWSDTLVGKLKSRSEMWKKPGTVALFGGLRNEPDLISDLMPWVRARGWRTVLFSVEGTTLVPYEVTQIAELKRGPLGVWEPVINERSKVPLAELSLILVPGLAFDTSDGSRLGRGGGFYDRMLADSTLKAFLSGVCFQLQISPNIPCESHDARVQEINTENGNHPIQNA